MAADKVLNDFGVNQAVEWKALTPVPGTGGRRSPLRYYSGLLRSTSGMTQKKPLNAIITWCIELLGPEVKINLVFCFG